MTETMRRRTFGLARITAGVAAAAWLCSAAVQAHISVWPRESAPGATEKYTVRIPTEGTVATTAVDIEIPDGVVVETMLAPGAGWSYEAKKKDNRIVAVTWKVNVKPGEFIEVGFVARNPRGDATQIVWTLRQHFADGTSSDWTKAPNGTIRPTAITKLVPAK